MDYAFILLFHRWWLESVLNLSLVVPWIKFIDMECETQTNHNPYLLASKEKVIVGLDKKKQDISAEQF